MSIYNSSMKRRLVALMRYPVALMLLPTFVKSLYCPFPLPWILCHICQIPFCPFKFIRQGMLISIIVSTTIAGRAFCSWICPMGSIQDIIGHVLRARITWRVFKSSLILITRLLLLVVTILLVVYLLVSPVLIEPIELLVLLAQSISSKRIYIFAAILLLSVLIFRPWCLICPLGFILGNFNKVCLVRFTINKESCSKCHTCTRVCKVGLKPTEVHISSDCIKCLDCSLSCPLGLFKPTVRVNLPSRE
ncbi:MAG: hypothetical protein DRJ49_06395 [Thermoprotei archaeon]|nr:MAG: hypothetical protein DRJ49_06395 [Thermoprotei archaeon]